MTEKTVTVCDKCYGIDIKLATYKCLLCNKDLCSEHNCGAFERSKLIIGVTVYTAIDEWLNRHTVIDVCGDCLKVLRNNPFTIPHEIYDQLEEAFLEWKEEIRRPGRFDVRRGDKG